jgi:hypothetical protein
MERAKGSMRGGLALSLEDSNSRMVRLGRDELAGMPHLSTDERLENSRRSAKKKCKRLPRRCIRAIG